MAQPITEAEYIELHVNGRFPNDPDGAKRAIAHFRWMQANGGYTTATERILCVRAAKSLGKRRAKATRCLGGCGKAMPKGTTCFWCQNQSSGTGLVNSNLSPTERKSTEEHRESYATTGVTNNPVRQRPSLEDMKELVRLTKAARRRGRAGAR